MSDSTHSPLTDLSGLWAPLGLAATFIGFVLVGGKKLRQVEEHGEAVRELREEQRAMMRKLDALLDAVNLLGKTSVRLEAEVEAIRRDVDRLLDQEAA